jgi:NAD(P)-dependent dehydrogenase (short-subunit alcohol dehydrogenase family)
LRRYAVLDTPCEREFEELAELAAQICRTPLAAIGLMDADREWFKATFGMSVTEVPRATSLSAETIQQSDVLVVNDTLSDARFRDKFLVNGIPASGSTRALRSRRPRVTSWARFVLGSILTVQAAAKRFGPEGGSIINVSSIVASHPVAGVVLYASTKGAIETLTKGLALELAPRKIRVNAISPGHTETEGTATAGIFEGAAGAALAEKTPLGRLGRVTDIAPLAVFLASDESAWITGEIIRAAGGVVVAG